MVYDVLVSRLDFAPPARRLKPQAEVILQVAVFPFTRRDPEQPSGRIDEGLLEELRAALRADVADLVVRLLGEPNKSSRRSAWWRWGGSDGMAVCVRGPQQGACTDFRDGWKGDLIGLIQRSEHRDFVGAITYGCNFAGLSFDRTGREESPHERSAREEKQRQAQAERDAEGEAEDQRKIAFACQLWEQSISLEGTVGYVYLTGTRRIPRPADGWPEALRFHSRTSSLIVAGTTEDGAVQFVQLIYLTADAHKINADEINMRGLPRAKQTFGVMAGAVVRLPGPADGPLCLAEGPETGLSVWAATRHQTWMSIGSITQHKPPSGRRCAICRDDDAPTSPADKALKRAMGGWRAAAIIDVVVATPWPVRRGDKSDFNDLIRAGGAEAVRKRIQAALEPPHKPVDRMPVEQGRIAQRAAIDDFYGLLPGADGNLVHAIRSDVGSGKTEANLENVATQIRRMRDRQDKRVAVIAVPTHDLGDQQMARFLAMPAAKGISVGVWRSRQATDADGELMCRDLDAIKDANEALADVQTSACRRKMSDGTISTCEYFSDCRFQKQRLRKHDVIFMAHELIYAQKPKGVGDPAFLVADESAWQDGLFGIEHKNWLLLDTLTKESASVPGRPMDSSRLRASRLTLHLALSQTLHSAGEINPDDHIRIPAIRDALLYHGIDAAAANECYGLEWKRKIEADIYPGMPTKSRKEAVAAVIHNKIIQKLGILWRNVAHLVGDDGPKTSGRISIGLAKPKEGVAPAVFLKGRRKIHEDWQVPTLILDATMQPELVKHFWPVMKLTADIRLQMPHQHITQVIDRSYSKGQLTKASGLRDVHAIICREARRTNGRVLVVVQQGVEEALPRVGPLPGNVELAHHNAVEGKDQWGPGPGHEGVVLQIVLGRTAPSTADVEDQAEALTGEAIDRIPERQWYPKVEAFREMADGTFKPAQTDRHPHPVAEAIRWQIAEGQLIQILGRPRGVNRTGSNPVDILLLTDPPLPIPVSRLISAADLEPSPFDLMMAAGGVALVNPTDASDAYPKVWATREAAKKAFERRPVQRVYGRAVAYQRSGERLSPVSGRFDPATVPDIKTWLTERLGPLVLCHVDGQPDPAHKATNVWEEALSRMAGGVLPIAKAWLVEHLHDLFPSERTAARQVANLRVPKNDQMGTFRNKRSPITVCPHLPPVLALFRVAGQKVPSKALIRADVPEPRAEIALLLGAEVVSFEVVETPVEPTQPSDGAPGIRMNGCEEMVGSWSNPEPRVIWVDFVCAIEVGVPA